jgi:hypothetical protein
MKFSHLALATALLSMDETALAYSTAFVPKSPTFRGSFLPQQHRTKTLASRRSAAAAPFTMLVETSGGMEELQELTDAANTDPVGKQLRRAPSFWKLAGRASIPVGALLGFSLVPSRRLVAHAAGAIVTGIAGAVGKSKLDALLTNERNAKPALAQALIDAGIDQPESTRAALLAVKEQYGLQDEDFSVYCTELYTSYLLGMVKYNPVAKTSELKELESVRAALSLTNLQVGEAHAQAAQQWHRAASLVASDEDLEDPDHPERQAMDKLLFLTERAFRGGDETEEAFRFEMTRVAKALHLDLFSEAVERAEEVAESFYQRALVSTRAKLASQQVSSDMLTRARATLGISTETAKDMHIACFNAEVRELLGLSELVLEELSVEQVDVGPLKFPEGATERVRRLCSCTINPRHSLNECAADPCLALIFYCCSYISFRQS